MSEQLRCPDCLKLVTNGRWIGTWHLCLSKAERAERQHQLELGRQMIHQQRQMIAEGPSDLIGLDMRLWNAKKADATPTGDAG